MIVNIARGTTDQGCSPRPAEKPAAPPRPAKSKPCPAPQKLTKPAGRNGANLTTDYTDYTNLD